MYNNLLIVLFVSIPLCIAFKAQLSLEEDILSTHSDLFICCASLESESILPLFDVQVSAISHKMSYLLVDISLSVARVVTLI